MSDQEPTLVHFPSEKDRTIRALMSVVDDLSVEADESGLLHKTLEHVVEALALRGGVTYLPGPSDELEAVAHCGAPPADRAALDELAGMAYQWGRPVVCELPNDSWVAATALLSQDRKLGALGVHAGTDAQVPERELLGAFGKQIGTGLANARLYAELRASIARSEVVNRIGLKLGSSSDLPAGIKEFAGELAPLVAFDRLVWAFVNETGDYLEIVAHPEETSWGLGSVLPVVGSGPGFGVLNDKAVLERDILKSHRFIEDMRLLEEGIRSYVLLPLHARGRSIGVLGLGSRREAGYDEATLARLQPLANALSLSLENLRLFQKTKELSITDELTPLYNVRFFRQMLEREIKLVDRYKSVLSIVFLDLDNFKPVNDTFGHLRGSRVLREVGFLLRAAVRETDYPARYGGDEFVVLLPQTDAEAAKVMVERLQHELDEHVFLQEEGINVRLGASAGCATYPMEAQSKEALIRLADERMYQNKEQRKASR